MVIRRVTSTCLVAVVAGLIGLGCYQETTLDQINQVPSTKPASARRPTASTKPKTAVRPAPKPQSSDPKVSRLSQETKTHADRVVTGLGTTGRQKPTTDRPGAAPRTTRPSSAKPTLPKKLASHVDDDAIELGGSAVRPRPAGTGSTKKTDLAARPGEKAPETKKPLPTVEPPKAPAAAEKPSKKPDAKATAKSAGGSASPNKPKTELPELPILGDKKSSAKPKPAKKAETAKPKPKPVETKKPSGAETKKPVKPAPAKASVLEPTKPATPAKKPVTPAGSASMPKVPEPPKLITDPDKTEREKKVAMQSSPTPPKPAEVSVRAAKADKKETTGTPKTGVNKPVMTPLAKPSIERMIETKREEVLANPNNVQKQVALRMLYLANGQPKKALAEIPNTHAPVQEILERLMDVNVAATTCSGRDTSADATKLLSEVEQLREFLVGYADLKIANVKLVREVSSFGVYQEITPRVFPAGQKTKFIVYCELANYKTLPTEDTKYRVLLSEKITVLNKRGDKVFETTDDISHRSQSPFYDLYLVRLVELPATQPPGEYVVRVTIEDKQAAKVAEGQIDLTLARR